MGKEIPCVEATPTRPRSSSNNCRDLRVNRQLRSRAWSLRRTAAPAGRWLYLGTNCPARRSTASLVKTAGGGTTPNFSCDLSITQGLSHHTLLVLRRNMQEIKKLTASSCVWHSLQWRLLIVWQSRYGEERNLSLTLG